jgi:hypothetical protein
MRSVGADDAPKRSVVPVEGVYKALRVQRAAAVKTQLALCYRERVRGFPLPLQALLPSAGEADSSAKQGECQDQK